jgi:hypothetical protein
MPNESELKEWLGKDVDWVVVGSDARHAHDLVGLELLDFEVATRDVARARARLELDCELLNPGIVDVEGRGDALVNPEVAKNSLEVDNLGRYLRGSHDLGLRGAESNAVLPLAGITKAAVRLLLHLQGGS